MTLEQRVNKIKELLIKGNNLKCESRTFKAFGYQFNYYTECFGDLNAFYFNKHEVIEKIVSKDMDNRPGTIKEKTLYVCVHDTASAAETAGSLAHANYVCKGGGGTSWHYSCGDDAIYHLEYDECMELISNMRFSAESDLFGNEKDDSFKGSIGNIYQSFGGIDVYPSVQEKAANLLYFITKNHSFSDGNKRIAAAIFLYFLERNNLLFNDQGEKVIADHTLVAIIVMIAESRPDEKETMIKLMMNFLK